MSVGIRFVNTHQGPTPFDGQWLKRYDPDRPGVDPRGQPMTALVEATANPAEALRFDDAKAAMELWRMVAAPPHHMRPDGKPNRPLTAFTIVIERLP